METLFSQYMLEAILWKNEDYQLIEIEYLFLKLPGSGLSFFTLFFCMPKLQSKFRHNLRQNKLLISALLN